MTGIIGDTHQRQHNRHFHKHPYNGRKRHKRCRAKQGNGLRNSGITGRYFPIRIPTAMHRVTHRVRYFSKKPIPVFFSIQPSTGQQQDFSLLILTTSFTAVRDILADAIFLSCSNGVEKLLCFPDYFRIQRVVRPFALISALNQPAFAQELHMVGQGGLGDLEFF